MIHHIDKLRLTDSFFSVDKEYTLTELVYYVIKKLNEIVEMTNSATDIVSWIKETGLPDEVLKVIMEMQSNGDLDKIINQNIFGDLNKKIQDAITNISGLDHSLVLYKKDFDDNNLRLRTLMQVDPDAFLGATDLEKIQKAVDFSIANNYIPIRLSRIYNLNGGTVMIRRDGGAQNDRSKPWEGQRVDIRFMGGGFIKTDTGAMFEGYNRWTSDISFIGCSFRGNSAYETVGSTSYVFDCNRLIRITCTACTFTCLKYVYLQDDSSYSVQTIKSSGCKYTFINTVLQCTNFDDLNFTNDTCEKSVSFIKQEASNNQDMGTGVNLTNCTIENLDWYVVECTGINGLNVSGGYFENNCTKDTDKYAGYFKAHTKGFEGFTINGGQYFDSDAVNRKNLLMSHITHCKVILNGINLTGHFKISSGFTAKVGILGGHIESDAVNSSELDGDPVYFL